MTIVLLRRLKKSSITLCSKLAVDSFAYSYTYHTAPAKSGRVVRELYTGAAGFVDKLRISVEAGSGGDGCVSFLREKFLPKGPPNGGSGGCGGDVYIVAVDGQNSLTSIPTLVRAGSGSHGKGSSMNGRRGQDVVIKVPPGTVVTGHCLSSSDDQEPQNRDPWVHFPRYEEENSGSDRIKEAERILRAHLRSSRRIKPNKDVSLDLSAVVHSQQPQLLCHGGTGGFGNTMFMTKDNRAPRFASRGCVGETMVVDLELKTIADIGLVGLPNAGKSTFLRSISNAKPKTASYAFTTLSPVLGTITMRSQQFTVADIPGIISGASDNKGLGHGFLRHIERAKVLCFILDLSQTPFEDYNVLQRELKNYDERLLQRQALIIANKADKPGSQTKLSALQDAVARYHSSSFGDSQCQLRPRVMPFSAIEGRGVTSILNTMLELVQHSSSQAVKQPNDAIRVRRN